MAKNKSNARALLDIAERSSLDGRFSAEDCDELESVLDEHWKGGGATLERAMIKEIRYLRQLTAEVISEVATGEPERSTLDRWRRELDPARNELRASWDRMFGNG